MERVIAKLLAFFCLAWASWNVWAFADGGDPLYVGIGVFWFGVFLLLLGETYGRA